MRCHPLRGLNNVLAIVILGLAPQALCCRPLRGLGPSRKAWAGAPGSPDTINVRARETGDSVDLSCAVARFAGSIMFWLIVILGLAPQALCRRPLRGLGP